MTRLAIIGGSGLTRLQNLEITWREMVRTPYGEPSGPLVYGTVCGSEVVFLPRHGQAHTIPPHLVNYRANLWALRERGVRTVIAVNAVGAINPALPTPSLAVPDQVIDYTYSRDHTFFDGTGEPVTHIDFTEPYCEALRQALIAGARECEINVPERCTYAATQGPRFETAAEINRLERDGADVVGMTGMPETALAREIGLCYASIAVVSNPAAGHGEGVIDVRDVERMLEAGMQQVLRLLECVIPAARMLHTDAPSP